MPNNTGYNPSIITLVFQKFMQGFFHLLYHSFAGFYDLVASVVSSGRWVNWVYETTKLVSGPRILELGFGPGHLQTRMHSSGIQPIGLDESRQMIRQTAQRLSKQGIIGRLVRGRAQNLPFSNSLFDCVVATFPTQFIFDASTIEEIYRVLRPGGRLVILSISWMTGKSIIDRALALLYKVTGQVPGENQELSTFTEPYTKAGFLAKIRFVNLRDSRLMFIIATK